jgi:hypothetical protein
MVVQELAEEVELQELAEDLGFNWPRDRAKVERVSRHLERGDAFVVCKQLATPTGGKTTRPIAHFDTCPTPDQIEEEVFEDYGGGTYLLFGGGDRSRVLRRVTIEGQARTPADTSHSKTSGNPIKSTLEDRVSSRLDTILESNPELADKAALRLLEKSLRVSLDNDKADPVEAVIDALEKGERIKEALGSGDSWKSMVAELIKGVSGPLGEALKQGMAGRAQHQPLPGPVQPRLPHQPVPEYEVATPAAHEVSPISGQVPRAEVAATMPESPAEQANNNIDWGELLSSTNWGELEKWTQGNAGEFAQHLYTRVYQEEDTGAEILIDLFLRNEPQTILEKLNQGIGYLRNPIIAGLIKVAGRAEDATTVERIVHDLTYTQRGQQWVVHCHLSCLELEKRIEAAEGVVEGQSQPVNPPDYEGARKKWLESANQELAGVWPTRNGGTPVDYEDDDDEDKII